MWNKQKGNAYFGEENSPVWAKSLPNRLAARIIVCTFTMGFLPQSGLSGKGIYVITFRNGGLSDGVSLARRHLGAEKERNALKSNLR